MDDGWRYVYASAVGTAHIQGGLSCQDASACRVCQLDNGRPVLVAVAADGAGSASHGALGAQLACQLFLVAVEEHLAGGGAVEAVTRDWLADWLLRLQAAAAERAQAEACRARELACTLLAAVVGPDTAVCCQIGDGAIVVASRVAPETYTPVFWPERGEYENETVFATAPDAAAHLQYELLAQPIDDLALLTDGLQRLALNLQTRTAHAPFFGPMLAPLRHAPPGHAAALSTALAAFLMSEAVTRRTDDDKTLVLATRRGACPQPHGQGEA